MKPEHRGTGTYLSAFFQGTDPEQYCKENGNVPGSGIQNGKKDFKENAGGIFYGKLGILLLPAISRKEALG